MLIFLKLASSFMFSWLGKIFEFLIKYWRITVPLLIVAYSLHLYFAQLERAEKAEQALATYQTQIKEAHAALGLANAKREKEFEVALAKSEAKGQAVIDKYQLNRKRENDNLRSYYEKRIANNRHSWADSLRDHAATTPPDGLPQSEENPSRLAESLRDCDGTITALERACQVTTNDYNRLRGWADAACMMVGCE